MIFSYTTSSPRETEKLAKFFGESILQFRNSKTIIALEGDLGAGKTTFIKGLARGFGITKKVTSPTFIIARTYPLPKGSHRIKTFFHIDAYRLKTPHDVETSGVHEMLKMKRRVIAIEWADLIENLLPSSTIIVKIKHVKGNRREISFSSKRNEKTHPH